MCHACDLNIRVVNELFCISEVLSVIHLGTMTLTYGKFNAVSNNNDPVAYEASSVSVLIFPYPL